MRFLCDENIGVPVYNGLEKVGLDIRHILLLGFGGNDDSQVFQSAIDEGRILITRNYQDFAPLVERYNVAQSPFPGVLFVSTSIQQADVGGHVRALKEWMDGVSKGTRNLENTFSWLH